MLRKCNRLAKRLCHRNHWQAVTEARALLYCGSKWVNAECVGPYEQVCNRLGERFLSTRVSKDEKVRCLS
jgi:hypothetical protein